MKTQNYSHYIVQARSSENAPWRIIDWSSDLAIAKTTYAYTVAEHGHEHEAIRLIHGGITLETTEE